MKKVFICSPLRGDYQKNIENAKKYSRMAVLEGYIPITPHIYLTQFLDDKVKKERELALKINLELMDLCDEMWVFGNEITDGMRKEINYWNDTHNILNNIIY